MKHLLFILLMAAIVVYCKQRDRNSIQSYKGTGHVTQGIAQTREENIFDCDQPGTRIAAIGEIKDQNGNVWRVPRVNNYNHSAKAYDLYNECINVTPDSLSDVDLDSVPVHEMDESGDVITGYIFADNYFELYINGQLIAVDPVPYTPFNSNIVKFRVSRPYTIAVRLIDWEENLGVGTEDFFGTPNHPGDGGFIASFSDGIITNNQWKAQTFYTSPIQDLQCLSEVDNKRLSDNCTKEISVDVNDLYGVHWELPENVFTATFDDSKWPNATTYTEEVIGVDNKNAYMNFIEKFSRSGAEFIWSTNVVLDNVVVVRYTVN